jgi:hypothetical protein
MNMKFTLWQWIFSGATLFVLLLIFSAYFAPDMMVALTNQVWAMCGW